MSHHTLPTLLEPQSPAVALATPPVPATTLPLDDPLLMTPLAPHHPAIAVSAQHPTR